MGVLPIAKLQKLIPMLISDHDAEVLSAVKAIKRELKDAGCDIHDLVKAMLAAPVPTSKTTTRWRPPPTSQKPLWETDALDAEEQRNAVLRMAPKLLDSGKLDVFYHNFVTDLFNRALSHGFSLSAAERRRMIDLIRKYA